MIAIADVTRRVVRPSRSQAQHQRQGANGADGQLLLAHFAEPGSSTEQGLQLLATISGEQAGSPGEAGDPTLEPRSGQAGRRAVTRPA